METHFLISYFKNIYTFSDLLHFYFFLLRILFYYIIILVFLNLFNFFIFFNSKNQIFWNLPFFNYFTINYNLANQAKLVYLKGSFNKFILLKKIFNNPLHFKFFLKIWIQFVQPQYSLLFDYRIQLISHLVA